MPDATRTEPEAAVTLAARLALRLRAWDSLAALCARGPAREDPGEALVAHVWDHRDELRPWLHSAHEAGIDGPVALAMRTWLRRWLWTRNQFLTLDEPALALLSIRVLHEVHASLIAADEVTALRSRLAVTLAQQREALAELVRARLGDAPRDVTCGHYSPALQLEVLGLAESVIADPVLDIGCGVGAELVLALRARGHDARGIDRDVPAALGESVDWLRYGYGVDRWGTVISHLGFSLHFLHHHLGGQASAYAHAEVYMQVLRSLAVGGVFAYAPGLPFIEAMLPRDRYRLTRVPLPAAHLTPTLRQAQLETGLALGQASQIRRLV